jgi:secreted PhoX family phosphatase
VICEDGPGDNYVRAVAPDGLIWKVARNAASDSEFCGACFSPDGRTMFVNVQRPGTTFAITGDWDALRAAARSAA